MLFKFVHFLVRISEDCERETVGNISISPGHKGGHRVGEPDPGEDPGHDGGRPEHARGRRVPRLNSPERKYACTVHAL